MKVISSIILTLGVGAALMGASVSPAAPVVEEKKVSQPVAQQPIVAAQPKSASSAIKLIAPQKDLESAIRNSKQGDILIMGSEGWYCIESKTLKAGTQLFVLGSQGAIASSFPKEANSESVR